MGLTHSQASLTKYVEGSPLAGHLGHTGARQVVVEELAEAVTGLTQDHRQLFIFVFDTAPEPLVIQREPFECAAD
jgi:hypothetical protein